MEFPSRFPFDTAPFDRMICIGCGCPYVVPNEPLAPSLDCQQAVCPCHQSHWDSVPELEKRALWGDR